MEQTETGTLHVRMRDALIDEFVEWVAAHPNAGLFSWDVAATNALKSIGLDDLDAAVERAHKAWALYVGDAVPDPRDRPLVRTVLEAALTP